jgi:hypothetical protein
MSKNFTNGESMIYGSGDKLLREFAEANDRNNLKVGL